jgi:hypothetical protein
MLFTELKRSWIMPSDVDAGWEYQFVLTMERPTNWSPMPGVLEWCGANLNGEFKQWHAYILIKTEDDAFRFKMRYC